MASSGDSPFDGFWMGGFEGADHVNGSGVALDMAAASGHMQWLAADHARAARAGLACVRESIGWRLAEPQSGRYDLQRVERIADSAARHGLQVLWTLMHYGIPADLSLHDDRLIEPFAAFAAAVARRLRGVAGTGHVVVTPINEISYLAWAASQPAQLYAPNNLPCADAATARRAGFDVKRRLVRAALAAMAAMRAELPGVRFMHVEPLVHVAPGEADGTGTAAEIGGWQWQALDLLGGRLQPELGGSAGALDIIGVNHYFTSQWALHGERVCWEDGDARWQPFATLLRGVWQRYGRPLVIAETGHVGAGRAAWLHDMAAQVRRALREGVPVRGLCLYPLADRPDWDEPARWHRSGLWHVDSDDRRARTCVGCYAAALRTWQRALPARARRSGTQRPLLLAVATTPNEDERARAWQLMSRLAGRWHVVLVAPSRAAGGTPRLLHRSAGPWLDLLTPLDCDAGTAASLLRQWWRDSALPTPQAWLQSPHLMAVARAVRPLDVTVDEQAAVAALDLRRFAARPRGWAVDEATALQPALATPRIGCTAIAPGGAAQRRLGELAAARPDCQFVMLGDTAAPSAPPDVLPNLRRLNAPYALWPALLRRWDAAIVPHDPDMRQAGLHALEYAAAGVPVAAFGDDLDAGLQACKGALAVTRAQRDALRRRSLAACPQHDWQVHADALHRRLRDAVLQGAAPA